MANIIHPTHRQHVGIRRRPNVPLRQPGRCDSAKDYRLVQSERAMRGLRFVRLTPDLLPVTEPWFDDTETIRFLGGREWIRRELRLVDEMPGSEYRGRIVVGRDAWIAFEHQEPAGFIDVERYDDRRGGCTVVVAPHLRCKGIGRSILNAVWERPELGDVEQLIAGVEPQNVASRRCLTAAGFTLSTEPDQEGSLQGARARPSCESK